MVAEQMSLVDELVKHVADLLPFPVQLTADMGGTFVLQIDLGTRGCVDDPPDTAGIDGLDSVWWFDVEGGRHTIVSDLGFDAAADVVAEWITAMARSEGSPAAQHARAERAASD